MNEKIKSDPIEISEMSVFGIKITIILCVLFLILWILSKPIQEKEVVSSPVELKEVEYFIDVDNRGDGNIMLYSNDGLEVSIPFDSLQSTIIKQSK